MNSDLTPTTQPRRSAYYPGYGSLILGLLVIAAGLVLLLDNFGVIRMHDLWDYWPLALIGLGASRMLESRRPGSLIWGGAIATIGVFFLLDNLDILKLKDGVFWPIIIIAVGISMLLKALDRQGYGLNASSSDFSLYAIFSGSKRRMETQDFRGGDALAVFGGIDIDLRSSQIASGQAVMDLNAMFGGIEVRVPPNWRVVTKGMGIFGGFEDKTVQNVGPAPGAVNVPELIVTGNAIFGGVVIK